MPPPFFSSRLGPWLCYPGRHTQKANHKAMPHPCTVGCLEPCGSHRRFRWGSIVGVLSQTSRPSRPEASAAELLADTVVRTRPWHRGTVTDAERTTTTASLGGRATGAAARVSSSWASTSSSMSSRGTVDRERERERLAVPRCSKGVLQVPIIHSLRD